MGRIGLSLILYTMISCTGTGQKDDEEIIHTPRVWDVADRGSCINDMIKVRFFTGSTRVGRLLPTDSSGKLPIEATSHAGVYKVDEIQWIECNGRIIYPGPAPAPN